MDILLRIFWIILLRILWNFCIALMPRIWQRQKSFVIRNFMRIIWISFLTVLTYYAVSIGGFIHSGAYYGLIGAWFEHNNEYSKAELYYEKGFNKAKGSDYEWGCPRSLGDIYSTLGDYSKAINCYRQSLAIAKARGHREDEDDILFGLGRVFASLGDYTRSLEYYKQSLAIAKQFGNWYLVGANLQGLGVTYQYLGDYSKARESLEQALSIANKQGFEHGKSMSLSSLGDIALEQLRFSEALGSYIQNPSYENGGFYLLRIGEFNQAIEQFNNQLVTDKDKMSSYHQICAFIGLGLSYEGLHNWSDAFRYFQKAVNRIETERDKLDTAARRQFLGGKVRIFRRIEAYEGLARVALVKGDAEQGFYWAEHTKARLFLEALARKESGSGLKLPTVLATQENEVNFRIDNLYKIEKAGYEINVLELFKPLFFNILEIEITKLLQPIIFKSLESGLVDAKQDQQAFIARLRKEQPAYAAVAYPQPLLIEDIKLKPKEVLLEYEVTETATLAWLVKAGKILNTKTIPISRKDLSAQVEAYKKQLINPSQFDPALGNALYKLLFKAFKPLIADTDQLIVVPDDVLALLPFEALVVDAHVSPSMKIAQGGKSSANHSVQFLGDRLSLSYAQSATALVQSRQFRTAATPKGKALLVVADPVFALSDERLPSSPKPMQLAEAGLAQSAIRGWLAERGEKMSFSRLPSTEASARRLAVLFGGAETTDILTGFDSNEDTVKKHLEQGYRYGIFATHGILADDTPYLQEPALVLSLVTPDGKYLASEKSGSPGFLTLAEVMSLNIDSDLLALTACNTGIGRNLLGEGVMGMGRGFQYAGVESVVMSLWSVNDEATNLLTEKFFLYLRTGKGKLEALRLARAEMRQTPGYEHPYYWAPFILMGEP